MKRHLFVFAVTTAALLVAVVNPAQAQRLCETIVRDALDAAETNCQDLDGEQACYAYDSIASTFYDAGVGDTFSRPGTLVDLPVIHTVQSSAYDEDEDEWGIGYFQLELASADLPPDEPVRIILMGDVLLENAVTLTDNEFEPFQKLYYTAAQRAGCQDAMNEMVVQTPKDVSVDLVVNDVPVRIGSTVVFGQGINNGNDVMFITVIEGQATLYPGTPDEITIQAEEVSFAPLSPAGGAGTQAIVDPLIGTAVLQSDGTPAVRRTVVADFGTPVIVTEDGEGFLGQDHYQTMLDIPLTLLNYDFIDEGDCDCPNDADIVVADAECSVPLNDTPIEVTFTNTTDTDIELIWFDFSCEGVFYEEIPAGESILMETTAGHEWGYFDPAADNIIAEFIIDEDGTVQPLP